MLKKEKEKETRDNNRKKETLMPEKIIVVSPHPDDETLGAGGTILKYKDSGSRVYWLNVTNMKEGGRFSKKMIKDRMSEIKNVLNEYKFDDFFDLRLNPARLDRYPLNFIIGKINKIFEKVKPDLVILPYKHDIHSDHRIVFESAYASTKIFRHPYIKRILMMEIISETEFAPSLKNFSFVPNYFVNIADFLDKKLKIMKIFKNEVKNHPFPRSTRNIKALATFRGTSAGCKYAEAFMLLKEIQ